MHPPDEQEIKRVWSVYWNSKDQSESWDSLSEVILLTLLAEQGGLQGRAVLEAGCGTGRISQRLAESGARVTCLDITQEALELAKQTFGSTPGDFVLGSILDVPRGTEYDLVWNAGVLEHFKPEDQRHALSELVSILKPSGMALILTPYARSPLYRLGKSILEAVGRWPYGVEIPEATLAALVPDNAVLEREYTVATLPLFFDSYKFLKPLRRLLKPLWRLLVGYLGPEAVLRLDRYLSHLVGGYLLVSILRTRNCCASVLNPSEPR